MNRKRQRNKSLLFIVFNNKKSGGLNIICSFAKELFKEGYDITFFAVFGKNNLDLPQGIRIITIINLPLIIFRKFDYVISTFWITVYISLLFTGKEKIYLVQGWEPDFYNLNIYKNFVRKTYYFRQHLLATSDYIKNNLKKLKTGNRISKIQLFLDEQYVREAERLINGLNFSKKIKPGRIIKPKFLSVISSDSFVKGIDEFNELIFYIKRKYPSSKIILVSYENNKKISADTVYKSITPPEIISLMRTCHLYLHTSKTEGFSLPPLEAMGCGLPVVMTDSGGNMEYAKDGINCIVKKNINGIIKSGSIGEVLRDSNLRSKLMINGLITVSRYSVERSLEDLKSILI